MTAVLFRLKLLQAINLDKRIVMWEMSMNKYIPIPIYPSFFEMFLYLFHSFFSYVKWFLQSVLLVP